MDKRKILEEIKEIAFAVGKIQLEYFRKQGISIQRKSSSIDLVTQVDKACEYYIIKRLKENYQFSILSEEAGIISRSSDYQWVIDPLDGTNNYASGYPIFCVSIALMKGDETILGVVYVPIIDEMYTAIQGEGAFINDQKMNVSYKKNLNECLLATGFPYDRNTNEANNINYFAYFTPKIRGIRRSGSAAFDLVNVANGILDGFWEINLSLWDIAAAQLMIKEAGGIVKRLKNKRGFSIIAGSEVIVQKLDEGIERVDKND
ncbi:MAG TPA: inositol monophosphatase family protein [Clostridia bacterium]|nr:inositol monophosphatase family protein [Clostridia bacterium]